MITGQPPWEKLKFETKKKSGTFYFTALKIFKHDKAMAIFITAIFTMVTKIV